MKSWLGGFKHRLTARLDGRLKGSTTLSEALGAALIARAAVPVGPPAARLDALLQACKRTSMPRAHEAIARLLQPYLVGDGREVARRHQVGWQRYYGEFGELGVQRGLTTSLVLKAPRPGGEKGVLYCSFEYNWMRLLAQYDAAAVLKDYYLVGATSWSPTDYASFAGFAGLSSDPLFIGISNPADMAPLALLRPVVEPLDIMASDWIDPTDFTPKPHRARTIDIIMVANWTRTKRHWLLFEALRDLPRHLRVVLIGRNGPGRTEKEIRAEAAAFGVKQDLELHTNLEIQEVATLLADARISTIFTKREGSCVATAESLFAGAPVGMMEEAHIGSKAYLNPYTGVLLRREGLARRLQRFLDESETYSPRQWAEEHIACGLTSARLSAVLRRHAEATGRPWTQDVAPMCWRYVPAYVNPADEARLAPAVEELRRKHGVVLEKFLGERETKRRKQAEAGLPIPQPVPAVPTVPQHAPAAEAAAFGEPSSRSSSAL
jgi:glycosyltransferase involved in cell wall biosynthesis